MYEMRMDKHVYDLQIRVLIYREDGEYCAHALEMDLMGFGKTSRLAVAELTELIYAQISFARFKNDDSLLLFPAERALFKRWEEAQSAALRHEVFPDEPGQLEVRAVCIKLDQKRINSPKQRFDAVEPARA